MKHPRKKRSQRKEEQDGPAPTRNSPQPDQRSAKKYTYDLFIHQEDNLIKRYTRPRAFWEVTEYYPSYLMIRTPYTIPGQLPCDIPWFYAWLTVMDEQDRQTGFIIANLINMHPPSHFAIGTYIRERSEDTILEDYYKLRRTVKKRIEDFWNNIDHWEILYEQMMDYSEILSDPFDVPPGINQQAFTAEINRFQRMSDQFFSQFTEPESIDDLYDRLMREIDKNEKKFDRYS